MFFEDGVQPMKSMSDFIDAPRYVHFEAIILVQSIFFEEMTDLVPASDEVPLFLFLYARDAFQT